MSKRSHRVIKATYDLQIKAGSGDIPPEKIRKANEIMQNSAVDFRDIGRILLHNLKQAIEAAKAAPEPSDHYIDKITRPVMELKANGQTFKYDLVSILANIMLGFLEHIRLLDRNVIEIIDVHYRSLDMIVHKGIMGDGGQTGLLLKKELEDACTRYYTKNPQNFIKI